MTHTQQDAKPQNGAATAALITGIVAVVLGLFAPILMYWLTGAAGVTAFILGFIGYNRAQQQHASGNAAAFGIVLGLIAVVLAAVAYNEVQQIADELSRWSL